MSIVVRSLEAFAVSLPRDVPYLGPLGPGEKINAKVEVARLCLRDCVAGLRSQRLQTVAEFGPADGSQES